MKKGLKIFLLIVGCFILVAGFLIVLLFSRMGTPTTTKPNKQQEKIKSANSDEIQWAQAAKVVPDSQRINLLLVGQDRRENQGRQRSDAMLLVSMNTQTKKITVVSLMRDMYVPIPNYGGNRINAAYAYGGIDLLTQTVQQNFGVDIDGVIEADYEGFEHIVDLLGGLDLELSEAEAKNLNDSYRGYRYRNQSEKPKWNLKAGMNHMSGVQVQGYVQSRAVGNSDYERTERQRLVLVQMANKIKKLSYKQAYQLLWEGLPYVTTNLTKKEIIAYSFRGLQMDMKHIQTYRLPVDGTYQSETIRGMAVLVPDLEKNRAILKDYLK